MERARLARELPDVVPTSSEQSRPGRGSRLAADRDRRSLRFAIAAIERQARAFFFFVFFFFLRLFLLWGMSETQPLRRELRTGEDTARACRRISDSGSG